jgi:flagellar basal body L-ring protein FlgH
VARRVGDILTIQLVESTNASKSAVTTTKKNTTPRCRAQISWAER